MRRISFLPLVLSLLPLLTACAPVEEKTIDRGIAWVRTSAEFNALSLQAFAAASEDLDKFLADRAWSAMPQQINAAELPPAIITDVDETMVSNVEFQATYEPPFANYKLDDWNAATVATPLPGAVDFVARAQAAGVTVFFLTNRPCEAKAGVDDPCPQKAVTVQDLREAGIDADPEHVLLSNEQPGWDREKLVRREHIAESYRIIMLLGDDLGDFIACTRHKPLAPCTQSATMASRDADVAEHARYWGEGWYILPNPMHGSWTTVE